MIQTLKLIEGHDKADLNSLFKFYDGHERVTRLSNYPLNIVPGRSNSDTRRYFFTNRVATKWNELRQTSRIVHPSTASNSTMTKASPIY